jgi:hypothetical protein
VEAILYSIIHAPYQILIDGDVSIRERHGLGREIYMATMTRQFLEKVEVYYYWMSYKDRDWYPLPEELKAELLCVYGEEPLPYT